MTSDSIAPPKKIPEALASQPLIDALLDEGDTLVGLVVMVAEKQPEKDPEPTAC